MTDAELKKVYIDKFKEVFLKDSQFIKQEVLFKSFPEILSVCFVYFEEEVIRVKVSFGETFKEKSFSYGEPTLASHFIKLHTEMGEGLLC